MDVDPAKAARAREVLLTLALLNIEMIALEIRGDNIPLMYRLAAHRVFLRGELLDLLPHVLPESVKLGGTI